MQTTTTSQRIATLTTEQIEGEISHTCDGPVTRFVLIARAMDLVANGADPAAASNALYNMLNELGSGEWASTEY